MDPTLIALGVSFGLSSIFGSNAEAQQESALRFKQAQINLSYQQQLTNLHYIVRDTLDHQAVVAASRGVGTNSPTYQAFQSDVLNKANKFSRNLNLENSISNTNTDITIDNLKESLYGNLFGNFEKLALGGYEYRQQKQYRLS